MYRVLVTGANGFLATNIIIEMLKNDFAVRGLLRCREKYKGINKANLELFEAEITDQGKILAAMEDCDFVVHCAACTSQDLTRYSDYESINVTATEILLDLSIQQHIRKFIYISSSNTFGFGSRQKPGNEKMRMKPPFTASYYSRSKKNAQELVLKKKDIIPVVVLNPSFMLGAFDSKPSSGQIILLAWNKKIVFYSPGGKNFVDVKDVASGVINAILYGKSGEAYLVCNENLSYFEFFKKLENYNPVKPVYIPVPAVLLCMAGIFGSVLRLMGIRTRITYTNMRMICVKNYYSNRKAVRELKLKFHDIDRSIRNEVNYLKKLNIIES